MGIIASDLGIPVCASVGSNPATSTKCRLLTRDFALTNGLFRAKRHEKDTRIPAEFCAKAWWAYENESGFRFLSSQVVGRLVKGKPKA